MGGEEETILKHKVKARDKNHLTNKKPILDITSQNRIPILWIETKQAKILDLLRKPNFKCIKSLQKLGRVMYLKLAILKRFSIFACLVSIQRMGILS